MGSEVKKTVINLWSVSKLGGTWHRIINRAF